MRKLLDKDGSKIFEQEVIEVDFDELLEFLNDDNIVGFLEDRSKKIDKFRKACQGGYHTWNEEITNKVKFRLFMESD